MSENKKYHLAITLVIQRNALQWWILCLSLNTEHKWTSLYISRFSLICSLCEASLLNLMIFTLKGASWPAKGLDISGQGGYVMRQHIFLAETIATMQVTEKGLQGVS